MENWNSPVETEVHRSLAASLFNLTWDLMEKQQRSADEDRLMVHAAHASRFHWQAAGSPVHWARGEWQISRVYWMLGRANAAQEAAQVSLDLCQAYDLGPFDTAFAHEALARTMALQGRDDDKTRHVVMGRRLAALLPAGDDRKWVEDNLAEAAEL
jgi:hypothetical protein